MNLSEILGSLERDLKKKKKKFWNTTRAWMIEDKLRLNDSKTEFMIVGTRQQLAKVNIAWVKVV